MTHFDDTPSPRRAFLTRVAAVGAGAAAYSLLAPHAARASGKPILELVNVPDNENFPGIPGRDKTEQVLNYALSLETLEADLYRQALNLASGKPLDTPLAADVSGYALSVPAGALSAQMAQVGFTFLSDFAGAEAAHRDFLRSAIQARGGEPVGPNPGGYRADFGSDLHSILTVIRAVEEKGVRAYLGAAQFINGFDITQTAASIYSTECRHSAALNYVLGMDPGPTRQRLDSPAVFHENGVNNFEHWQTPEQILEVAKTFYA
ncbi:MAG: ferritin-like domain-containing protein [Armatimonadetes bacterium]|nr:ferritin-like domain-containing protein [Armatimonadota bacterium]